jgi:hypothetical protein
MSYAIPEMWIEYLPCSVRFLYSSMEQMRWVVSGPTFFS